MPSLGGEIVVQASGLHQAGAKTLLLTDLCAVRHHRAKRDIMHCGLMYGEELRVLKGKQEKRVSLFLAN